MIDFFLQLINTYENQIVYPILNKLYLLITCLYDKQVILNLRYPHTTNILKWKTTRKKSQVTICPLLFNNQDLYIPRKCSATGRLITAKDHASVQINVGDVDASGKLTGTYKTFSICGYIRAMGESDDSINRLASGANIMKGVWSYAQ